MKARKAKDQDPAKPCGARRTVCHCNHHRREHAAGTGKCSDACGCERFRPRLCTVTKGLGAGGKCRLHGGKSLTGLEHPRFGSGRWATHLPEALGGKFAAAYGDRTLMQLRQDAALVDAMLTSYTGNLKTGEGRTLTPKQETRVMQLLEQRRKIVESEARRLRDLNQLVPVDQYRTALGVLFKLMTDHLGDNLPARREIQAAARRLLLGKGPVVEGEVVTEAETNG